MLATARCKRAGSRTSAFTRSQNKAIRLVVLQSTQASPARVTMVPAPRVTGLQHANDFYSRRGVSRAESAAFLGVGRVSAPSGVALIRSHCVAQRQQPDKLVMGVDDP